MKAESYRHQGREEKKKSQLLTKKETIKFAAGFSITNTNARRRMQRFPSSEGNDACLKNLCSPNTLDVQRPVGNDIKLGGHHNHQCTKHVCKGSVTSQLWGFLSFSNTLIQETCWQFPVHKLKWSNSMASGSQPLSCPEFSPCYLSSKMELAQSIMSIISNRSYSLHIHQVNKRMLSPQTLSL